MLNTTHSIPIEAKEVIKYELYTTGALSGKNTGIYTVIIHSKHSCITIYFFNDESIGYKIIENCEEDIYTLEDHYIGEIRKFLWKLQPNKEKRFILQQEFYDSLRNVLLKNFIK